MLTSLLLTMTAPPPCNHTCVFGVQQDLKHFFGGFLPWDLAEDGVAFEEGDRLVETFSVREEGYEWGGKRVGEKVWHRGVCQDVVEFHDVGLDGEFGFQFRKVGGGGDHMYCPLGFREEVLCIGSAIGEGDIHGEGEGIIVCGRDHTEALVDFRVGGVGFQVDSRGCLGEFEFEGCGIEFCEGLQ